MDDLSNLDAGLTFNIGFDVDTILMTPGALSFLGNKILTPKTSYR